MSSGISALIDEIYQLTQEFGTNHSQQVVNENERTEKLEKVNALWEELAALVSERNRKNLISLE